MNTHDLGATEHYFDALAADWDRKMILDESRTAKLNAALDWLDIRPGDTVIDAGCGSGVLLPFLSARIGPHGRVIGIDLAPGMVRQAEIKSSSDRRFLWKQGEIVAVLNALGPSAADRIACFSAFPHFADKGRVLEAFYRALKPSGRFAVFHLMDSQELNRFHAGLVDTPVCHHMLPPAAEVAALAGDCGFAVLYARDGDGQYVVVAEKGASMCVE